MPASTIQESSDSGTNQCDLFSSDKAVIQEYIPVDS
jgi:hypothetical protein